MRNEGFVNEQQFNTRTKRLNMSGDEIDHLDVLTRKQLDGDLLFYASRFDPLEIGTG